jgi:hypothetical protein
MRRIWRQTPDSWAGPGGSLPEGINRRCDLGRRATDARSVRSPALGRKGPEPQPCGASGDKPPKPQICLFRFRVWRQADFARPPFWRPRPYTKFCKVARFKKLLSWVTEGGVPPILMKHSDCGTQPNGSKSVMTAECFFIGRQVLRKHSFEETLLNTPTAPPRLSGEIGGGDRIFASSKGDKMSCEPPSSTANWRWTWRCVVTQD